MLYFYYTAPHIYKLFNFTFSNNFGSADKQGIFLKFPLLPIVADSGFISNVCKIYLVSGLLIHRGFFFNLFPWKVMESILLLLVSEKLIEVQRPLFCFK